MKFTSFEQVVTFMEHFTNLEKKTDKYSVRTYRLDRMQALMEKLGNPQDSYKTIHVAGSKGKGSTATFIANALQACGFTVGLYMSPHVSDYRERFTNCGNFIDDEILIKTGNQLASSIESFSFCDQYGENQPTTFELYTAFAFMLFKEIKCQWAVIETGLGGRLDATNIIKPQASVLTPIELEHTDILGDTIEKIAIEKSKIIKPNVPCFIGLQNYPQALEVFKSEAFTQNSNLYSLGQEALRIADNIVEFRDGYCKNINLSLKGLVQAQNYALALLVVRKLGLYAEGKTEEAMSKVSLPGRMEEIKWKRTVYLDGAHTQNSMRNLLTTFRKIHPGKDGICIFGCVAGKNYEVMSRDILENFDKIVVCRPGTFKKSDPEALYNQLIQLKKPNQTIVLKPEAKDALSWCLENTSIDEAILDCGSFYLAGVIKKELCK